jgi:hypothetical protein
MGTIILKPLLIFFWIDLSLFSIAQYKTTIVITDIKNQELGATMEHNASVLLTEINQAFIKGKKPSLDETFITEEAKRNILSLWEMSSFRCYETDIFEKGINRSKGGYEVRNIPLFMKKADSADKNQEAVIVFTSSGLIEDFLISIDSYEYKRITEVYVSMSDLKCRQSILHFVENYLNAILRKDVSYIDSFLTNDGKTLNSKNLLNNKILITSENTQENQVTYQNQTKEEYVNRLKFFFRNNNFINIRFESIEVTQHPDQSIFEIFTLLGS